MSVPYACYDSTPSGTGCAHGSPDRARAADAPSVASTGSWQLTTSAAHAKDDHAITIIDEVTFV